MVKKGGVGCGAPRFTGRPRLSWLLTCEIGIE